MAKFAVIIPAYNEENVIKDCLDALVTQSFPDYIVCFIDDASTDSTKSMIEKYIEKFPQRVKLFEFGKVGPGHARNRVAEMVDSPILAFTDADCAPDRDWLKYLNEAFDSHPDAAAIGGPQFAMPGSNDFQKKEEFFYKITSGLTDFYKTDSHGDVRRTAHNPLCNVAYRRDVYHSMKGFRTDFYPGEDIEFDIRLQKKNLSIYFQPRAKVFHHRPPNISGFRKVMFTYGLAQGRLVREHGVTRKVQWVGIFLCVILFAAFPIGFFCRFGRAGLIAGFAMGLGIFLMRAPGESMPSLWINSAAWLRGFVKGLVSKAK